MQSQEELLTNLDSARVRFLEQQCLVSELEDMLHELQYGQNNSSTNKDHLACDHTSATAGQQLAALPAPDAARSLAKHLQAAFLAQRLQLPQVPDQELPPDVSQPDQLGSMQHLLGVIPQQLRHTYLLSRKAAQKELGPFLPALEERLNEQAGAALAAIAGPSAGLEPTEQVVMPVKDTQQSLAELQQSNMKQLLQVSQEALGYLGDLDSIHAALQQLVGKWMLQEQPDMDKKNWEYQEVNLQQLISKLRGMQLATRGDTYAPENMAVLSMIRDELEQAEQQLQSKLDQVESQLVAYSQLGDEFHSIVQEYGSVKAAAEEVDGLFESFVSMEKETALFC